jgi:glycosyltransferase involved in cell wall biosynthesis
MRPALLIGNHLSRHGHTIKFCEELAERLRNAGWPILTASDRLSPAARLADMTATVWRERRRYEAAYVAVFSGRAFLWAEATAYSLRACGKPFVLTLHGGALPEFARRNPRRVRRLLGQAAAVTTPSPYLGETFRRWRPDILEIPNAIQTCLYEPRERREPRPRLIWLRAFHEIYNPALAIETLAGLHPDYPDAVLAMVGPDKGDGARQRASAAVARMGLEGAVTFAGGVAKQRVPSHLSRADIFLNTSNVDNAPVSVLEAMAAGLCIVSTSAGGMPDLLEHESDALLVPPGDAAAMAKAVRRILQQPGLAQRLSHNAMFKAQAFDWSAILPRWERLLDELGGAPKC